MNKKYKTFLIFIIIQLIIISFSFTMPFMIPKTIIDFLGYYPLVLSFAIFWELFICRLELKEMKKQERIINAT